MLKYILLILLLTGALLINTILKLKRERADRYEEYLKSKEDEIRLRLNNLSTGLIDKYNLKKKALKDELTLLTAEREKIISEVKLLRDNLKQSIEDKQRFIDSELKLYKKSEMKKIAEELALNKQNADESFDTYMADLDTKRSKAEKEYDEILETLQEYRKKQIAVNEAIIRERKIQDSIDFYRIKLTDNDIADIKTLEEMAPLTHNKDIIPRVIWEMILKRPLAEMIKRITNGREISGIYKITNINTGESYIGKTTNIQKRWTDHCKTAIGLDGAASSTFHTRLAADGIQNYTWEILEEVEKDNLSEREKYYIDFYDTKNFGLNQKAGG